MRLEKSKVLRDVYSRTDSAIAEDSDWAAYAKDLDPEHLRFVGEPTAYKMRTIGRDAQDLITLEVGERFPEDPERRVLWMARMVYDAAFVPLEEDPPLHVRIELGFFAIEAGALTRPTRSR
jgi:hypothetical protein